MQDFTQGNATKQIISFALPMLVGNIFQQVYNMADTMMVGRFVSGSALAAVGTSGTLINFMISIMIGLTTGASIVISQFYGARQEDNLKRTVSTSFIFMLVLAIFLSLGGFIFAPFLLRLLNVPGDIFDSAVSYVRIILAGASFPLFFNMYTAFLRALGDSKTPLYILIFSTLLNIALDYIFIVNLHLGVAGAAYATILAQSLAAVFCFLYASKYIPLLRITKLIFDREIFKSVLKYSIPAALQLSMTNLAALTITRLINAFGSVSVAGFTSATKIDQFATMPLSNISMAVSTFVGQNMGAGLEDRAKKGFYSSMAFMIVVGVFVSAFAIIFGPQLIGLFVDAADPDASQIIQIGTEYLSIISIFYILFAVFFAFNGFFRGVGDAVIVMILTVTSLSIRSICAHLLVSQFSFGPEAVAWSIPVGWGLCSLYAFYYYKRRKWAGKVVVKPAAQNN